MPKDSLMSRFAKTSLNSNLFLTILSGVLALTGLMDIQGLMNFVAGWVFGTSIIAGVLMVVKAFKGD